MQALRNASGFLGTNASLLADITLVIQILFFIVLCIGVAVQLSANRGKHHLYPWHDRLQAPVVVLNLLFIIFVMIPSFGAALGGLSSGAGNPVVLVPTIHGLLGLVAEGLGIYCLLAGFKILPRKIGTLRYFMWSAFVAWTITILFGIGVYLVYYTGEPGPGAVAEHDADIEEIAPTEPAAVVEEHAEEPVEVAPEPQVELVEEHAEEPVEVAPETPAATEEVVEATEEVEEPAVRAGVLRFTDSQVHSDFVTLQVAGVAPLDGTSVYEGWLQGETEAPFSLGILPVEGDAINHTFQDPQNRRLLDIYDAAFITIEPAGDTDPNPSGNIVYQGQVVSAAMAHVRHVVTAFPASPDGDGLALNAVSEAIRVVELVTVQQQYVNDNNRVDLLIHAENTINIIEGANGPNFGDIDGDGETYSGDGFGLLRFGDGDGYLQTAADHANLAAGSDGASAEVILHAEHVNIAAANAIGRAEQIRDLQLQVAQVVNAADAAALIAESLELANALVDGIDANGDGQVAPAPGEGGVQTMYQHGQLMGSIELFSVTGEQATPADQPAATPELIDEHDADVAGAPAEAPLPEPAATPELVSEHDDG